MRNFNLLNFARTTDIYIAWTRDVHPSSPYTALTYTFVILCCAKMAILSFHTFALLLSQSIFAYSAYVSQMIPSNPVPLAPSPPSNTSFAVPTISATSLTAAGITCFERSGGYNVPVYLDECIEAVGKSVLHDAKQYVLPRVWKKNAAVEGIKVPVKWQQGGCNMVVNTQQRSGAAEFSILAASYFASLALHKCIVGEKESFGGRFLLSDGGFYVDIVGGTPSTVPITDLSTGNVTSAKK